MFDEVSEYQIFEWGSVESRILVSVEVAALWCRCRTS